MILSRQRLSQAARGFTIVETMLFLAISMLILVGAIIAVGGQQRRTQFSQSMRDLDSYLQDVFNDVSNGYYNPQTGLNCTVDGSGVVSFVSGGVSDNTACTYIGKVIQFAATDMSGEVIHVYTVAGRRMNAGMEVTTLAESNPAIIGTASTNAYDEYQLQWGVKLLNANLPNTLALGVFSTFGNTGSSSASGAITAFPLLINGVPYGASDTLLKQQVAQLAASAPTRSDLAMPSDGVALCFQSGDGGQKAQLIIGRGSNGLSTKLIFNIECSV